MAKENIKTIKLLCVQADSLIGFGFCVVSEDTNYIDRKVGNMFHVDCLGLWGSLVRVVVVWGPDHDGNKYAVLATTPKKVQVVK